MNENDAKYKTCYDWHVRTVFVSETENCQRITCYSIKIVFQINKFLLTYEQMILFANEKMKVPNLKKYVFNLIYLWMDSYVGNEFNLIWMAIYYI